ncbi:MAG: DMT family transporter [Clostridia bacterium]|nr:DMT family transporter [Clostridia bacterium]
MSMKRNPIIGILLMLACAVLWSTAGLFIKSVPWNSMVLAGWRGLAGTLTLWAFMRMMRYRVVIDRRTVTIGLCVSGTSILFLIANRLTTAANAIVLQYTSPVFLMVLSALLFKRRYRSLDYLTVAVTVGGIALFFCDQLTPGGMLGNILALIDGVSMGAVYLFTGESDEGRRLSGILMGLAITAVVGIPFTFAYPPAVTGASVLAVIAMGFLQLGLPYALYSLALKHCPTLACTLIASFEIILSPLWVWFFLGEMPGTFAIIGSVIIVATITVWCCLGGAKERNTLQEQA